MNSISFTGSAVLAGSLMCPYDGQTHRACCTMQPYIA